MNLHAKMAMSDLQRNSWKLCLIKYFCLYSFAVSLYQITVLITSKIIISNCGFYHRELQSCAWRVTGIITLSVPLKDLKRLYLLSSEVKKIPGLVAARLESFGVNKSKVSIYLYFQLFFALLSIFSWILKNRFFTANF